MPFFPTCTIHRHTLVLFVLYNDVPFIWTVLLPIHTCSLLVNTNLQCFVLDLCHIYQCDECTEFEEAKKRNYLSFYHSGLLKGIHIQYICSKTHTA